MGGIIVGVVISLFVFCGFFIALLVNLDSRLPDNNQPLATRCYVDKRVRESGKGISDGYFTREGLKREGVIIDQRKEEIKVRFNYGQGNIKWEGEEWIPKKDFVKYYTLKELSEIVQKKK